jgi:hypothetical protein
MENSGVRQFGTWKAQGILASYHLLFSRYVDTSQWDMLAVLQFHRYQDVAKWWEVEKRNPAGLAPDLLALVDKVETYPVDLSRTADPASAPAAPVYLVLPYVHAVPPAVYLKYADDYVRPQLDGWTREGILAGFGLYTQRYTATRPWDSMLILQYKDDAALGLRETVVAKVRKELETNPVWKALSDRKDTIRTEKAGIIADEILMGR